MVVRDFKAEDHEAVKKLAEAHKLNLSTYGKIIVVEAKDGEIKGFANIRPIFMIEPMVCDNSLVADKLWAYISEKSKAGDVKTLRCFVEKKHVKLLSKIGFYQIFKNHTPMEVNFY